MGMVCLNFVSNVEARKFIDGLAAAGVPCDDYPNNGGCGVRFEVSRILASSSRYKLGGKLPTEGGLIVDAADPQVNTRSKRVAVAGTEAIVSSNSVTIGGLVLTADDIAKIQAALGKIRS